MITYFSPVGGGYGDPLERDPAMVLDDVLDGFITAEHARDDYGVVLDRVDDGYGFALNAAATRALRAERLGSSDERMAAQDGVTRTRAAAT